MSEHTPGPWERAGNKIVAPGRGTIAIIPSPGTEGVFDMEHNARLMAAAPDLLDACVTMLSGDSPEQCWDALDKARLAVAKSEGRT